MDDPNRFSGPKPEAWCVRLDEALSNEREWRERAGRVVKVYRGEDGPTGEGRRFNILFPNVSILRPALYQRPPQADVRRRFSSPNPLADRAADVLQKGAHATLEAEDADRELERGVMDMLLPGRGTTRVRWEPVVRDMPVEAMGFPVLGEDGQPLVAPRKVWEDARLENVYWEDFLHEPARNWKNVGWVAFRHFLTERQMRERFGEAAEKLLQDGDTKKKLLSHDLASTEGAELREGLDGAGKRALVWECWDRETRTVSFVARDLKLALLETPDPLGLRGFYPCPEPMYAVTTTDQLVPVPEFAVYQDLAAEVDRLTDRIDAIMRRLRVRGAFNGSVEELADILGAADGEMIAVDAMNMDDLNKAIWMLPLDQLTNTAVALYGAREQAKQTIYEMTGISDILRGSSQASETATAQRIKGNFGTLRINDRRKVVERHGRDVIRLITELMARKFAPSTLQAMTGEEVGPDLAQFLRRDALLWCLVDVESDSTVAPDEAAEQEAVAKLVGALTQLVQGMAPVIQAGAMPLPMAVEFIKIALKPFKGSRDLVEMLDELAKRPEAQAAATNQGGPEQGQAEAEPASEGDRLKAMVEQMKGRLALAKGEQDGRNLAMRGQVEAMKLEREAMAAGAPQRTAPAA